MFFLKTGGSALHCVYGVAHCCSLSAKSATSSTSCTVFWIDTEIIGWYWKGDRCGGKKYILVRSSGT